MATLNEHFYKMRGLAGVLVLLPVGVLIAVSTPHFSEGSGMDIVFDAAGWVLLLLGIGLRLWATLFIGGRKDTALVTAGPYSLCRNPLYLGSLCAGLSMTLFLNSITFFVALIVIAAVYFRFVIPSEEQRIEATFGEEYRRYLSATPRLLPRTLSVQSPAVVEVSLAALQTEARRLLRVCLIPILAEVFSYVRTVGWFPHWFRLP